MTITMNKYGKVYQLGHVSATLIPFDVYQKQVAMLGANQAQDIQPDGHLGFVASIAGGSIDREVDANEETIESLLQRNQ